MEIRALAISRRSIMAIRRPNRVAEGARPIAAVLDIDVPLLRSSALLGQFPRENLCIPDTSSNSFVCIAAFYLLQCSIVMRTRFAFTFDRSRARDGAWPRVSMRPSGGNK